MTGEDSDPGPTLWINLLGRFELQTGGCALQLRTRRAQALLIILALAEYRPVSRQVVMSLLWPDRNERQAAQSLSQEISTINSALDFGAIGRCPAGIFLASSRSRVDFIIFSDYVRSRQLHFALPLLTGPLLPECPFDGEEFDAWLRPKRINFNRCAIDAMVQLGTDALAIADFGLARKAFTSALHVDEADELAHAGMVRALVSEGRLGAAIAHYKSAASTIMMLLDTEPGGALRQAFTEAIAIAGSGPPISRGAAEVASASETFDIQDHNSAASCPPPPHDDAIRISLEANIGQLRDVPKDEEGYNGAAATDELDVMPKLLLVPLIDMTGDGSSSYIVDGITEEIIFALSQSKYFAVLSRNSSFAYKGTGKDVATIARETGADFIAMGTIRFNDAKAGRLVFNVASSKGENVLDSFRYQFSWTDVFEMYDELSEVILGRISTRSTSHDRSMSHVRRSGISAVSHPKLLAAFEGHNTFARLGMMTSVEICERIILEDPSAVEAMALSSFDLAFGFDRGWWNRDGTMGSRVRQLAEAALAAGSHAAWVLSYAGHAIAYMGNYDLGSVEIHLDWMTAAAR